MLKIVLPIVIGLYLTWYFFSGLSDKQLDDTKNSFFDANYFWVLLGLIIAFLSHLSRAYRWLFLLEPLGFKPSLKNSYHAVMSGYVINFTVPRSGEIARAGLLTNYEDVPFEKGFATIVIERVIDVIMLGIVVFISGLLQTNAEQINDITLDVDKKESYLIYYILGTGLLIGLIVLFFFFTNERFKKFCLEKLKGFAEGLKSIWIMKKKWSFLFHTVFIWACYVGSIWVFAQAFEQTADMPIGCVFAAFVVGAAAIAIFPGGIGAYPLWVNAVLGIYMIDFSGFGIFIWVAQTALIVSLGLLSLLLIQRQPKLNVREKS